MSDERYAHATLPSEPPHDTEVDPPKFVFHEPRRVEQTLHFPQLIDEFLTT